MASKASQSAASNGQDSLAPDGWRVMRFDEFAENVAVRVDPAETDAEVYIGLEHLDSDSLKIERWGSPDDVTGQKLAFRRGDIIFGRRRAYQKKLAVADHDGICSAHAMVIRPVAERVDSDFLPFFLQSDGFMSRAVEISVGSLSPTINWKTLRRQEFTLPPVSEQKRIATVLAAVDETIEAWCMSRQELESVKVRLTSSLLLQGVNATEMKQTEIGDVPVHWDVLPVGDITTVVRGSSPRPKGDARYYGGPVPRLMVADVTRDGKYVTPCIDTLTEEGATKSRWMEKGDLVMVCSGSIGVPAILNVRACIHDGFLGFRAVVESVSVEFLYYQFVTLVPRLTSVATHGGIWSNLTTKIVKEFLVTVPPKQEQEEIVAVLRPLDEILQELNGHIECLRALKRSLAHELLSHSNGDQVSV